MTTENIKIYTIADVAKLLKLNKRTVWNHIKNGKIKAKKIGGKWFITEANFKNLVE